MEPEYRFKFRRVKSGTDPVLLSREPGFNLETSEFKIGDGRTRWSQLKPYTPSSGGSADLPAALADHVNAAEPHPVYDDGPSLALLYNNAKV